MGGFWLSASAEPKQPGVPDQPALVRSADAKHLPSKTRPQKTEIKLVFLDKYRLLNIFKYDVEASKTVSEFEQDTPVLRDISLLGNKESVERHRQLFLDVGDQALFLVNPRIENGEASNKEYKTN